MAVCHSPMIAAVRSSPYACCAVKEEFSSTEREAGVAVSGLKWELVLSSYSMKSLAIFFLWRPCRLGKQQQLSQPSCWLPLCRRFLQAKRARTSAVATRSLAASQGPSMPQPLREGGQQSSGRCFGVGRILSCWLQSGEGMSGKEQPCSWEGGLVDAATSGEAGSGSWCFANRFIVVSRAKVPGTAVPVCGQV